MRSIVVIILIVFSCQNLLAQYTINGSAVRESCNSYTLTAEVNNQSGSVWNNTKINLTQSFDFKFDVYLGRLNANGADGIAFVMQPISTSVGSTGGGLGYEGITPAVGVTIDTWQNANNNDPYYDHIAIQLNGDIGHSSANNIAGPVTAVSGNDNIEDSMWHSLRIQWDAVAKSLTVYVDGVFRVSSVKDFIADVFSGNPMVYWGFTGSTGGAVNWQRFRTALSPAFYFSPNQKRCVNEPLTFYDTTVSFAPIVKFYWDFGDGSPIDSVDLNPTHVYTVAGDYTVIQRVIGADGCEATNTQIVRIGSKPIASFNYLGTMCIPMPPNPPVNFLDSSYAVVGTVNNWFWDLNNGNSSTLQNPSANYISPGNKTIKLAAKTGEGCESDTLIKLIHLYSQPVLDFTFTDSVCSGTPILFSGIVVSGSDPVTNWFWSFPPDTSIIHTQNAVYVFTTAGIHTVNLMATSSSNTGCLGSVTKNVFVVNKPIAYFKYNTICQAVPAVLTDSSFTTDGTLINQWWWNLGNGTFSLQQDPSVIFPVAGTDTVRLVVQNAKGCLSDTLIQPIVIYAKPSANFGYSKPMCNGIPVQFSDSTTGTVNQWSWLYGGSIWSSIQKPTRSFLTGTQTVGLLATTLNGCISDTVFKTFYVNPIPAVTLNFNNGCANTALTFTATENPVGTVSAWKWVFGDGGFANAKDTQHLYRAKGLFNVKLYATAATGCYSDSLRRDIMIYSTNANAGNDTIAAAGQPVQLNGSGGVSYLWSPVQYLDNPNIYDPVAILRSTQTFNLKAYSPEGCASYAQVTIKIYNGPDIYLPNAFSPNGDGLNDVYRGIPVGIREFRYLRIFNRYGGEVFSTTDHHKGWDGTYKGAKQVSGVYVVVASGIDFRGNPVNKNGTIMLIR